MYCKHCGRLIADDSVFCSKCGKKVVDVSRTTETPTSTPSPSPSPSPKTDDVQWVSAENLQWEKPLVLRAFQIVLLLIIGYFSLYPFYCFISGGKTTEYITVHEYGVDIFTNRKKNTRIYHSIEVKDPLNKKILEFTNVEHCYSYDSGSILAKYVHRYAQNVFRWKMALALLPFFAAFFLVFIWIRRTRFPGEKDVIPRDIADEVEQYEWSGFTRNKYVFYKKDGKYGVIDASNYCINIPAQYDSVKWRMPNKLFDARLEDNTQTIKIEKGHPVNPNKSESNQKQRVVFLIFGIVLAIWGLFHLITWIIPDFDCVISHNYHHRSPDYGMVATFFMFLSLSLLSFFLIKKGINPQKKKRVCFIIANLLLTFVVIGAVLIYIIVNSHCLKENLAFITIFITFCAALGAHKLLSKSVEPQKLKRQRLLFIGVVFFISSIIGFCVDIISMINGEISVIEGLLLIFLVIIPFGSGSYFILRSAKRINTSEK